MANPGDVLGVYTYHGTSLFVATIFFVYSKLSIIQTPSMSKKVRTPSYWLHVSKQIGMQFWCLFSYLHAYLRTSASAHAAMLELHAIAKTGGACNASGSRIVAEESLLLIHAESCCKPLCFRKRVRKKASVVTLMCIHGLYTHIRKNKTKGKHCENDTWLQ